MAAADLTLEQARLYDLWHSDTSTDAAVDLLSELAGNRPTLELGIGTGRYGLALAARGIAIDGVERSAAKIEVLREKTGGHSIRVISGEVSDVCLEGPYGLVFATQNALFGLPDQEAQLRCFTNVAEHLERDGVFLVEAFVPDPSRYALAGQAVVAEHVGVDGVRLSVARHDEARQHIFTQRIFLSESGFRMFPLELRYAWPSELDLMAQLAGLRLRSRWSGWGRQPFWASSTRHVSLYQPD